MKHAKYLIVAAFLIAGCSSSGSNSSKQDVLYRVGVIDGWKQGDSLEVEYVTGYESERSAYEYESEVITDPEFSTSESVDLSQSDIGICIRAQFISSRFFEEDSQASAVLRMELRAKNQSVDNQFDMGDGGADQASVCIDGEADE